MLPTQAGNGHLRGLAFNEFKIVRSNAPNVADSGVSAACDGLTVLCRPTAKPGEGQAVRGWAQAVAPAHEGFPQTDQRSRGRARTRRGHDDLSRSQEAGRLIAEGGRACRLWGMRHLVHQLRRPSRARRPSPAGRPAATAEEQEGA